MGMQFLVSEHQILNSINAVKYVEWIAPHRDLGRKVGWF